MTVIHPEQGAEGSTLQASTLFITIRLPLNSEDPYKVLEELISTAKDQLNKIADNTSHLNIDKKLNKLKVKLPPQNLFKSLFALISEDTEEIIPLNIEVDKKVFVGSDFDKKEIENLKKDSLNATSPQVMEYERTQTIYQRYYQLSPFGKRTY